MGDEKQASTMEKLRQIGIWLIDARDEIVRLRAELAEARALLGEWQAIDLRADMEKGE